MGGGYDVDYGQMSPEEEMVYRDLTDVIRSEFERLSGLYSGCSEVDWMELGCAFARCERDMVVYGLPCDVYVGVVFAGGGFLDFVDRRYRFEFVFDGEGGLRGVVLATFRVVFIGDKCFVRKTVDYYWLEWLVGEIVGGEL